MIEYAIVHFETEEVHLRNHSYPDLKGHVKQHEYFVRKVEKFIADFDNDKPVFSGDLIFFLRDCGSITLCLKINFIHRSLMNVVSFRYHYCSPACNCHL